MKEAAEQTVKLVKGMRTMNVAEVLTAAGSEVPRLFCADRIFIRFDDGASPAEVFRRNCLCPAGDLAAGAPSADGLPVREAVPEPCRQRGCSGERILMPLAPAVPGAAPAAEGGPADFVCLCGWPPLEDPTGELLQYKAMHVQDILSTTLLNAVRYREAHRTSNIDALTELWTRRVLQTGLQNEVDRGLRYGRPFCLAFLDVDHFKAVNDSEGHNVGDDVLRAVAAVISSHTRDCDLVARYGGDEFIVLMPETDLPAAMLATQRLRKAVEETVRRPGGAPVTLSGGVAQWDGETRGEDFIGKADLALYQAKRLGRNAIAAAPHNPKASPGRSKPAP
jgi:diguanylate cyclase (GGDEF)-like protein